MASASPSNNNHHASKRRKVEHTSPPLSPAVSGGEGTPPPLSLNTPPQHQHTWRSPSSPVDGGGGGSSSSVSSAASSGKTRTVGYYLKDSLSSTLWTWKTRKNAFVDYIRSLNDGNERRKVVQEKPPLMLARECVSSGLYEFAYCLAAVERFGLDDLGVPFSVDSPSLTKAIEARWILEDSVGNPGEVDTGRTASSTPYQYVTVDSTGAAALGYLDFIVSEYHSSRNQQEEGTHITRIMTTFDGAGEEDVVKFSNILQYHGVFRKKVLLDTVRIARGEKDSLHTEVHAEAYHGIVGAANRVGHLGAVENGNGTNKGREPQTLPSVGLSAPQWLHRKKARQEAVVLLVACFDANRCELHVNNLSNASTLLEAVRTLQSTANVAHHRSLVEPGPTSESRAARIVSNVLPLYVQLVKSLESRDTQSGEDKKGFKHTINGDLLSEAIQLESIHSEDTTKPEKSGQPQGSSVEYADQIADRLGNQSHVAESSRASTESLASLVERSVPVIPATSDSRSAVDHILREYLQQRFEELPHNVQSKEVLTFLQRTFETVATQALTWLTKDIAKSLRNSVVSGTSDNACLDTMKNPTMDDLPDNALIHMVNVVDAFSQKLFCIVNGISLCSQTQRAMDAVSTSAIQKELEGSVLPSYEQAAQLTLEDHACHFYWRLVQCSRFFLQSRVAKRKDSSPTIASSIRDSALPIDKYADVFVGISSEVVELDGIEPQLPCEVLFAVRYWCGLTSALLTDAILKCISLDRKTGSDKGGENAKDSEKETASSSRGLFGTFDDHVVSSVANCVCRRAADSGVSNTTAVLLKMVCDSAAFCDKMLSYAIHANSDAEYALIVPSLLVMLADIRLQRNGIRDMQTTGLNRVSWWHFVESSSASELSEVVTLYCNGLLRNAEVMDAVVAENFVSTCRDKVDLRAIVFRDLQPIFAPWLQLMYHDKHCNAIFFRLVLSLTQLQFHETACILGQTLEGLSSVQYLTIMVKSSNELIKGFQRTVSEDDDCNVDLREVADRFIEDKLWTDFLWSSGAAEWLLHLWYCQVAALYDDDTMEEGIETRRGKDLSSQTSVRIRVALAEAVRNKLSREVSSLQNSAVRQEDPYREDWCIRETLHKLYSSLCESTGSCMPS
eukprot:gb/GECG01006417.1/.p1 GENE.gb/GECG01006417.1/~~gb/GECG01006417.1/.p1  ORF type:complete len:1129 (+),score=141.39 gb/GECG01006417.1/:1-3387(+)